MVDLRKYYYVFVLSLQFNELQLHVYNVHTQIYHIKYAAIEYVHSLLVRMFRSILVSDEQLWKGSL
jgi:hypothetical protein